LYVSTVISVENVSKYYRLGLIGGGTLRADFERWWARRRGKPNPLLKIGQEDQSNRQGEHIWALRDVSFEVQQGEVLGIIGRNGAGKSTLLKILSRVTAPTSGQVKVKGRVASLLEVGTGFHPELTGRENIYLNGAILGMKKVEIERKFDEIVAFAEIEKFMDTPVKRYSSGMYVRLAFAVAAHLEPEILLVDEVLAVGDAAFQKKCLGKMGDVAREGRTVLFVSHNMEAIRNLCPTTILLQDGRIKASGRTPEIVDSYFSAIYHWDSALSEIEYEDKPVDAQFKRIRILNSNGVACNRFSNSEEVHFEVIYELRSKQHNLSVIILMYSMNGTPLFSAEDVEHNPDLLLGREPGRYMMTFSIPPNTLNEGKYYFTGDILPLRQNQIDMVDGFTFECYSDSKRPYAYSQRGYKGCLDLQIKPATTRIE
jgi:lipopolysaccharide transport system ATP-binding protein